MYDAPNEVPVAQWVRERFGIEDEDELRALLSDPTELLALLDVARAAGEDGIPVVVRSGTRHTA